MLGKTHMATTVATGSLGLYGLYHLVETTSTDVWYADLTQTMLSIVGIDFTKTGFSLLLMVVVIYLGLLIGSLLPDVDSAKSILGRYVPFIEPIVGHRTYFHTIWIVGLLVIPAYFAGFLFTWSIVVGYLFHLIQDSFSRMGVNWFYPLKKLPHIPLYRVGGVFETFMLVSMSILNVYMVYKWISVIFF